MAAQKVIIIGAGIAGPVLGIFLKLNGFNPVIYERLDGVTEAGLSLVLQPNGLHVLSEIPHFIDTLPGCTLKRFNAYSVVPTDVGLLGTSDIPTRMPAALGFGMHAVPRTAFHRAIISAAQAHGVDVHWGHSLCGLEQTDGGVLVRFANGNSDMGAMVVGCDGLHSATRVALFGEQKPDFLGLTQTGGISPTPPELAGEVALTNVYGDGTHMISYPISETHSSWAVTLSEEEHKETWRAMDEEKQAAFRQSHFAKWEHGFGALVTNAEKIVKYGLYDRPALQTWHKGRVVLLGDAAHPTSPHLGQGANQAFEDVHLLVSLLAEHRASTLDTAMLGEIFATYEKARIPKSAAAVAGARKQGSARVVRGEVGCKMRNDAIREVMKSDENMGAAYGHLYEKK
ncbi:FAD/NAD(P)-binding domain-containing protein [Auriscalpium vulgare]|uniref:FAD/NAD(P)-binding domain-containing protein n=1 Tax=Auriscalpium vulgare TaxID=40419 RepID=A0ACB8RL83_9AGAM|nr:FAD/NAD(P)-binding domain-containing protein [Auriscalpium vulgare]